MSEHDSKRTIVIWGAGRIGRGFVADLFDDPGWQTVFVDIDRALVEALEQRGSYTLHRMTAQGEVTRKITGYKAICTEDTEAIGQLFGKKDLLVDIAVHAPKLGEVAEMLAPYIEQRAEAGLSMDIMMNVNMTRPDEAFRKAMDPLLSSGARTFFVEKTGVTGIAAMCISPFATEEQRRKDPLAIQNNGWWEQAIDSTLLRCPPPVLPRIRLCEDVMREETRKLYTLNMVHACACYLGLPMGLKTSEEAAASPRLRPVLQQALLEASWGLEKEYGFHPDEMEQLRGNVLSLLENPYIVDELQRLGADSRRKLGPSDRLVGPARLCLKHGGRPEAICSAIAAGYGYENEDEGTKAVHEYVLREGFPAALARYSGIGEKDPLFPLITEHNT